MSGIVGKNAGRASGVVGVGDIGANSVGMTELAGGTDGVIITFDAAGDPVAVGPGSDGEVLTSTGAGSPPAFEAAAGGGDKQNFIIDPFFTQFPDSAITGASTSRFGAIWKMQTNGSAARYTITQETTVPTVAQAGYKIPYSMKFLVTTAEASLASSDRSGIRCNITGPTYAMIHQQEYTFSCWMLVNGVTDDAAWKVPFAFSNTDNSRAYLKDVTIASDNTWQYVSVIVPADTTGTYLFTEADVGLIIDIGLAVGTDRHGTDEAWASGDVRATSSSSNIVNQANDEIYLTACQLELGGTATRCYSPPIATVIDQVDYYVQRYQYDGAANETIASGYCTDTSRSQSTIYFRREMRKVPTGSSSTAGFRFCANACADVDTSLSVGSIGRHAAYFQASQSGTSYTAGQGGRLLRDVTDECFLMFDARH